MFKATATIPDTNVDFSRFGRRGNNEEKKSEEEEQKTIEVVAWYTLQVPVNQGPDGYWGLPGLI